MAYITERYSLPSDIKASDLVVNMLDCLPPETLRQIFQYLSYNDIQHLEKFEQLKYVINNYKIFLPRKPINFEINCDESGLRYQFNPMNTSNIFHITSKEELINTIKNCSLEVFKLRKINGLKNMINLVNDVFPEMIKSRQHNIISLSLIDINISSNDIDTWRHFFYYILNKNCKTIIIDNVILSNLFDHHIFNECKKITNVKWVVKDSEVEEKIKCGEIIMKNFTFYVRHSSPAKMETLYAHIEMINPKDIVLFIETWLSISCPAPFNIVIENCDDTWIEEFSNECIKSNLINYNKQISSNKSYFSHVKMSYNDNNGITKVTFNSIIDMPARHINQRMSHGRFYRDF
ncbi:Hypothetical protein SRAE_X000035800 [Strongyloides ratti]|uniref:F-box domain-containing protein n=1 Tax=Strongyloides ratti TaxID=34506 RepID=A0A090LMR1_STRRB|nr:Hypothetical protein SRAE_X000035800 [Strongyloides ratti]CEF71031.1 Hypothetical protein SRAE_X000035800 [Strongyloides ratti]